jgi:hypothetical protein
MCSVPSLIAGAQTASYLNNAKSFHGPQVYKEPTSGTILYVESDGLHVCAISKEGRILWNKNPFQDARLEPYRFSQPQIIYVGPAQKWMLERVRSKSDFIQIQYNSTQTGILNILTGEFEFMGQD